MSESLAPPPILHSARVISYAIIPDSVDFMARGALLVDGVSVGRVPRLAIAENLGEDIGPLLLHCDAHWAVLGVSGAATVDATKRLAERNYPGIGAHWVDLNISPQDALAYYDAETDGLKCSFCDKRPFEIQGGWVSGNHAAICRECVDRYHAAFQESTLG